MKRFLVQIRDSRGSQIAEAAMVWPIFFMLLFSIFWFGRAFNIYATIGRAAREGAQAAATSTAATSSNIPTTDAQVAAKVTDALNASHLDPNQISAFSAYAPSSPPPSCPSGSAARTVINNITIWRNAVLNPTSPAEAQECGVIVSFQYPYQFLLPFTSLNQTQINMKAQAQARQED